MTSPGVLALTNPGMLPKEIKKCDKKSFVGQFVDDTL